MKDFFRKQSINSINALFYKNEKLQRKTWLCTVYKFIHLPEIISYNDLQKENATDNNKKLKDKHENEIKTENFYKYQANNKCL